MGNLAPEHAILVKASGCFGVVATSEMGCEATLTNGRLLEVHLRFIQAAAVNMGSAKAD